MQNGMRDDSDSVYSRLERGGMWIVLSHLVVMLEIWLSLILSYRSIFQNNLCLQLCFLSSVLCAWVLCRTSNMTYVGVARELQSFLTIASLAESQSHNLTNSLPNSNATFLPRTPRSSQTESCKTNTLNHPPYQPCSLHTCLSQQRRIIYNPSFPTRFTQATDYTN